MSDAYKVYLIGIPEVDEEHMALIKLTREIGHAIISNRAPLEVLSLLDSLISSAQSHFAHEEEIFAPYRLPGEKKHKAEHRMLLEQTGAVRNMVAEDRNGSWQEILLQLTDIMSKHVITYDMEILPHLDTP